MAEEQKPNPDAAPKEHLQIKIKSQEGDHIEFKVKPTTKFEKVYFLAACFDAALQVTSAY